MAGSKARSTTAVTLRRVRRPTPTPEQNGARTQIAALAADGRRFAIARCGTVYGLSPGLRDHTASASSAGGIDRPAAQRVANRDGSAASDLDLGDAVRAIHFLIEGDRFDGVTYDVVTESDGRRCHDPARGRAWTACRTGRPPVMTSRSQHVPRGASAATAWFRGRLRDGIRRRWRVRRAARISAAWPGLRDAAGSAGALAPFMTFKRMPIANGFCLRPTSPLNTVRARAGCFARAAPPFS